VLGERRHILRVLEGRDGAHAEAAPIAAALHRRIIRWSEGMPWIVTTGAGDFSGRAAAIVDTKVHVLLVGDLQSELVPDFFDGFARGRVRLSKVGLDPFLVQCES